MRFMVPLIFALVLAGCVAQVPNSASGVGFGDVGGFPTEPVTEFTGIATAGLGGEISDEQVPVATEITTAVAGDELSSTDGAAVAPAESDAANSEVVETVELNLDNPDISDEQDFEAVTARESIESAAQRREAQQQAYLVIDPVALPTRNGGPGAAVVEFALSTSNVVGQSVYARTRGLGGDRFGRNCAKYASSGEAQADFLNAGGPERDRKGIDPDGDGFACFWDPAPFRTALQN